MQAFISLYCLEKVPETNQIGNAKRSQLFSCYFGMTEGMVARINAVHSLYFLRLGKKTQGIIGSFTGYIVLKKCHSTFFIPQPAKILFLR